MATQTDTRNPAQTPAPAPQAAPAAPPAPAATPEVPKLTLDFVNAPQMVTREEAAAATPKRARNEMQLAMDKIVSRLHADWVKAGKPNLWLDLPKGKYPVPVAQVDDLTKLINRAGEFLSVRIRYGNPVKLPDNRQMVTFAVLDKREVKPETREKMAAARARNAAKAATAAAGAPKPAPKAA